MNLRGTRKPNKCNHSSTERLRRTMPISPLLQRPFFAMPPTCLTLCIAALLVRLTVAHEHHDDKIPEGEAVSPDPIVYPSPPLMWIILTTSQDSTLWVHIVIQILAFGIIFPTGMVLGVCFTSANSPIFYGDISRLSAPAGTSPCKPSAPPSPLSATSSAMLTADGNLPLTSMPPLPRPSCSCSLPKSPSVST